MGIIKSVLVGNRAVSAKPEFSSKFTSRDAKGLRIHCQKASIDAIDDERIDEKIRPAQRYHIRDIRLVSRAAHLQNVVRLFRSILHSEIVIAMSENASVQYANAHIHR